jgi:DNA-directed RNA polymerase I, II, and III subunit RPABC1
MKHIKKYVEMMNAEKVSRALLIVQQNLTPFAKNFIIQELEPKIHLEVFQVGLVGLV